jgi:hypothetical protein
VDEGNFEAPSDWFANSGALVQTSNIWGGGESAGVQDPYRPGTYIWVNGLNGINYKIVFKFLSGDDDEMGVMFHYRDRNNYYRFSANAEQRYRRITKIVNGQASVIASQEFSYRPNRDYEVRVLIVDGRIQVYLDGRRIFDIKDNALNNGSIAFYCWKNAGTLFKDLIVTGQGKTVSVDEQMPSNSGDIIRHFSLSAAYPNPASALSSVMLQVPQPAAVRYKIFNLLGRMVQIVEKGSYTGGLHQLVWDGRDDRGNLVPAGIYFLQVEATQVDNPNKVLWQAIQKIIRLE